MGDLDEFLSSRSNAKEYPLNLVRTEEHGYLLHDRLEKLNNMEGRLFQSDTRYHMILVWERVEADQGMYRQCHHTYMVKLF